MGANICGPSPVGAGRLGISVTSPITNIVPPYGSSYLNVRLVILVLYSSVRTTISGLKDFPAVLPLATSQLLYLGSFNEMISPNNHTVQPILPSKICCYWPEQWHCQGAY